MQEKIKKTVLITVSLVLHGAFIVALYLFWKPIAEWYFNRLPARGVDLYLTGTYVSYLARHFSTFFSGWQYIWYNGSPLGMDYSTLYFYLILPLTKTFGLIRGIQYFALGANFLFGVFAYLLYQELSKNHILALILAGLTLFSINLYRAFIWAGGIPYFISQTFFPLTLFLLVRFLNSQNKKWLLLSATIGGLGFLGHPQTFINFTLPAVFFLIIFGVDPKKKYSFLKRIKQLFQFLLIFILVGLFEFSRFFDTIFSFLGYTIQRLSAFFLPGEVEQPPLGSTAQQIIEYERAQFNLVYSDTNIFIFYLAFVLGTVFILSLAFRKKRIKSFLSVVPYLLTIGWVLGSIFLLSRGVSLFTLSWYKAFFPVPVVFAMLAAFFWGSVAGLTPFWVKNESEKKKGAFIFKILGILVSYVFFAVMGIFLYSQVDVKAFIDKIDLKSIASSAYPEALDYYINGQEFDRVKEELTPKSFNPNDKNYRLYAIDATFNIWWNSFFDMPLTRGYVDPRDARIYNSIFWLNAALGPGTEGGSSLVDDWNVPEEVAQNNAKFLLDWYGTKYLEGNHMSKTNSNFAPFTTSEEMIKNMEKVETKGSINTAAKELGVAEWNPGGIQFLNFYEIKDDLISPIMAASNATPVLHIGDQEGYEILYRFLGMINANSQSIILARGPKLINEISFSDLSNFEAIILYKYDYKNYDKAWKLIGKYVEKGGKVFVDTGPEVKESDTTELPERFPGELPGIFPIKRTVRDDIGSFWVPRTANRSVTEGIDFDQFSPLIFEDDVWNVSHPISDDDIREDSKVILRHKDIPVVIERTMGEGKVIWSGFNLPYHIIYDYNQEEAKFFKKLLEALFPFNQTKVEDSKVEWISSTKRIVSAKNGKGVLFKEEFFPGWKASFGRKKLKIYPVGPNDPGFMYVRLPQEGEFKATFTYKDSFANWLTFLVSLVTLVFVFDYLLLQGIITRLAERYLYSPIKRKFARWWEKEDEY